MAYYQNKKWPANQAPKKGFKGELVEDFYNPYSFVPLADAPCYLSDEDARRVMYAQDIPYSDGMSGHIDVHFKAETPVCVKHDSEHPDNISIKGRYFIPGSSVKGMLRNVLEILSMSNIRNVMADDRYSMRDLGKNSVYSLKATVDGEKAGGQKPGFLFRINDDYYVMPCDSEAKQVRYSDMDKKLAECLQNRKSAISDKYSAAGNGGKVIVGGRKYIWLFSGFMNNKKHEYMLPVPDFTGKALPLKGRALQDFIFIHEEETKNESWNYWRRILKKSYCHTVEDVIRENGSHIAPCFFRTKKEDGEEVVKDLGFAFLYREPFKRSVADMLFEEYKTDKMDIASAVFGFTGSQSLKGRIQVQNAFIDDASVDSERHFILGAPKPTFYPFYLEQANANKMDTYSTPDAVISGWKRYLVHNSAQASDQNAINKKSASSFSPLKSGTVFTTRINYHNLQPYELGALLAAITFNGNNSCCHTLGYAKPLGYGKISVSGIDSALDIDSLMEEFRIKVCSLAGITREDWEYYISPLIDIAAGGYKKQKIRYPFLDKDERGEICKEFILIKENKKILADFSPVDE